MGGTILKKRCKFYEPNCNVPSRMARRRSRKAAKIEPAVRTMTFGLLVPENKVTTDHYISLSQCASLVNRRFYRAGLNWAVAGFTIAGHVDPAAAPGSQGFVRIYKIPDTWVASNAWEKGFHAWNELNKRALDDAESVKPKFLDFKPYMDADHHVKGSGLNLIPLNEVPIDPALPFKGSYVLGEWDMSSIIIPNQAAPGGSLDFEFVWVGENYPGAGASGKNAVSLIEGYAASRGLPDVLDPNAPGDVADTTGTTPENWISSIDNESSSQIDRVLTDMIDENNIAPYPFENDGVHTDTMYPGGANQGGLLQIHDIVPVTGTTVGSLSRSSGSNFQGGLIKVQTSGDLSPGEAVLFQVHLVAGSHRGYLCQPQRDV